MGRRVTVDIKLTIEIDDEMELAEAGFRHHREGWGAVVDGADISPDLRALVDAATSTPDMAIGELLGDPNGLLSSIAIPGAHIVGIGTTGPEFEVQTPA